MAVDPQLPDWAAWHVGSDGRSRAEELLQLQRRAPGCRALRPPVAGHLVAVRPDVTDLLPGFVVMSLGAGSVFVSVTAVANADVAADKAGLAAGLLNSSQQVGSALGLAILSAVAITRTSHLIASGASHLAASDGGYHIALLVGSSVMAAAALIALRISNTRQPAPLVMVNADATASRERASAPTANGAARARPHRYREH